jgi:hypothetical protein
MLDGIFDAFVLPGIAFGVVGGVAAIYWRLRWRFALPLTYVAFIVFAIVLCWYLASDPNLAGRYRAATPADIAMGVGMMGTIGFLPLVIAFLLTAIVGKRAARPPSPDAQRGPGATSPQ